MRKPAYGIWSQFLRPRRDLKARYPSKWAVITGGSDGLGEAYSH